MQYIVAGVDMGDATLPDPILPDPTLPHPPVGYELSPCIVKKLPTPIGFDVRREDRARFGTAQRMVRFGRAQ